MNKPKIRYFDVYVKFTFEAVDYQEAKDEVAYDLTESTLPWTYDEPWKELEAKLKAKK